MQARQILKLCCSLVAFACKEKTYVINIFCLPPKPIYFKLCTDKIIQRLFLSRKQLLYICSCLFYFKVF